MCGSGTQHPMSGPSVWREHFSNIHCILHAPGPNPGVILGLNINDAHANRHQDIRATISLHQSWKYQMTKTPAGAHSIMVLLLIVFPGSLWLHGVDLPVPMWNHFQEQVEQDVLLAFAFPLTYMHM